MRNGRLKNIKSSENFEKSRGTLKNPITNKNIVVMLVWMGIAIFLIVQVIQLIRYTVGNISKEEALLYNVVDKGITSILPHVIHQTTEEYSVSFAGLGDIYTTQQIINGSKTSSGYDFVTGTEEVSNKLKGYDLVIAPISTPIAGSKSGYSKGEIFNCPDDIIKLFKRLNISTVATASYHALDKGIDGAENTIKVLEENGINQVGLNNDKKSGNPIIMEKNNIRIGILSYTTSSNIKMTEKNSYIMDILDEEEVKKDVQYLKDKNVDYIISYLNVKNENAVLPNSSQKQNTELLFNSGVNVVLGTGARAVQEETEDIIKINNEDSHIYAAYCLGDFLGAYEDDNNRESAIANIKFVKKVTKDKKGNVIKTEKDMLVQDLIKLKVTVSKNYSTTMKIMGQK